MSRLYDADMYRFGHPEASFWEASAGSDALQATPLQDEQSCDVAIIGGGYTGLSAAYHLSRQHALDVRVLEAGHFGWGASGRNGGFCSIGGEALGARALVRKYGVEQARAYYASQVEAVGLVRDLIVDECIDAEVCGSEEVCAALTPSGFQALKDYAEFQFRVLGLDTHVVSAPEFRERYFDSAFLCGGVATRPTFGLHPLRYLRGLAVACEKQGALLHRASEVIDWCKDGGQHRLATAAGTLRARRIILATNAYAPEHLSSGIRGYVLPMISALAVTRPLTAEEWQAHRWRTNSPAITAVRLLNYFRRLPDGRFMFGGRGSSTGDRQGADRNYRVLIQRLYQLFPEWRDIGIDYRWHGLVCMTRRRTPAVGCFAADPSVFFGFGYHGNGVNTATWVGRQLATWVASQGSRMTKPPAKIPGFMLGLPEQFPFPSLRLAYARSAIAGLKLKGWLQRA